jgi:hypothetical protein
MFQATELISRSAEIKIKKKRKSKSKSKRNGEIKELVFSTRFSGSNG